MNSIKQCMNSEPMWGYCSRTEKKKRKRKENVDVRKRGMQTVTLIVLFSKFNFLKEHHL